MTRTSPQTLEIHNARDIFSRAPVSLRLKDGRIDWIGAPGSMPDGEMPARRIEAEGLWVSPGLCDSHLHLFQGGVTLGQLNLFGIDTRAAFAAALTAYRQGREDSPLLCAISANYEILGPGTRPDRHALDALLPDQPLMVYAVDLHTAWANTAALAAAGLMDEIPEVKNAEIVLGADGKPNGELREGNAMRLVGRLSAHGGRDNAAMAGDEPGLVSEADRAADKAAIAAAMKACAAYGITTAVNMDGNLYQAELLSEMERDGALPIRVSLAMRLSPSHDNARINELIEAATRKGSEKLSFGRIKMFLDGVFDTWTAYRTDDYPDRQGFRSAPLFTHERFTALCEEADARGLQIQVHCVGDAAVRTALDGYEVARAKNGARDARHRVEHIDMLHPDDLARFAALDVVASMQPVHPPGSSGLPLEPTVSIMGRDRWQDTFPWKPLQDAGATLAFGTDWPTAPLSPFNAIHSALSREPWAEDVPDQRIPFEAVIEAYTSGGAHALFAEGTRGALRPGMAADVVLLDGDPRALVAGAGACRAALTICDGAVVFEADA
ncbi:amidohydrolase [Alloyangia pacifica]|uniref:amidohydrolase n=1 Tax=Alloyangia pacifica TaxID=311180 RepID=UPI001CD3C0FE|nr:amidohydrolase [Alloyangia pacifica]MCA0997697.1 amidohydrolase [Alloyangia pacifica]